MTPESNQSFTGMMDGLRSAGYPDSTVATLNEGNTAIIVDDGCYVVCNRTIDHKWSWSTHIFREAAELISGMPNNPNDALKIVRGSGGEHDTGEN